MTAGRNTNSQNKEWCTPHNYVKAIRHFFNGKIELDPCSNRYSIVKATVEYMMPEYDGLIESWDYKTIYVNPPYGANREAKTTIKNWLLRCAAANREHASEVIALVPVASNTSHWKEAVWGEAAAICFLYDTRLKFLVKGEESTKGAPMSCALIYWGDRFTRFKEVFLDFGAVVDTRSLKNEIIADYRKNNTN